MTLKTNRPSTQRTVALHDKDAALSEFIKEPGLWQEEISLIEEFFPKRPARILDVGCGSGRTTEPLRQMGYHVVGVDICEGLIRSASQSCPEIPYVVGDVRALSFAASCFDAVFFSWNGLDYMYPFAERLKALQEMARALKPGGRLLFSSHNAVAYASRLFYMCPLKQHVAAVGRIKRVAGPMPKTGLSCALVMFYLSRLFKPIGMWMKAVRFILDQLPPRRWILDWYFTWRDPSLGMPVFYSAPPKVNTRTLEREGWCVLAVRGRDVSKRKVRTFVDDQVYYVCERS